MNRTLALGVVAAMLPAIAPGEAMAQRELGRPTASHQEPFDLIAGLRELSDGRVLVADGIAETIVALNLDRGTVAEVGAPGKGPGEYSMPDRLLPLPQDRTLLLDLGNGRMSIITPDGNIVDSKSIAQDDPDGNFSIVIPRATDGQGRVYFQPMGSPRRDGGRPDSAAVVRWDMATSAMDTVAMVKLPEVKVETSGSANNRSFRMQQVPYALRDEWAVAPDGSVAVARGTDGYRVDWYRARGLNRGPDLEFRPVTIRDGEKEEFIDAVGNAMSVMMTMDNGRRNVSFGRNGNQNRPDPSEYDWPDSKGPVANNGLYATPEGDVWVRREVPAGEPWLIDVVGRDGTLKEQIRLPAGRRLIGFGNGTVYLANIDQDDLQWLERYRR